MERTDELKERIRQQPLNDRLEESRRRIGDMCSKGRCPKMTIPVQHDDDDFYINTTLADAQATVEALQRERDEAITAHRNMIKQFDELTCFIGCDYDPETEAWVSGKLPYLSAGTDEVEACKAAVAALRSVAIVLQTVLDAEREKAVRLERELASYKAGSDGEYGDRIRRTLDATTPAPDTSIIGKCEPPSQWDPNAQVRGDIS